MSILPEKTDALRGKLVFRRRLLFLIFYLFCALALRFLYLWEFSESPLFSTPLGPDVEEYAAWANEILAGNFLWESVKIHSPLYPYFLAFLLWAFKGANALLYVRVIQILLGFVALVPICGALKLALSGDSRLVVDKTDENNSRYFQVLLVFMLLWAWYPPLIYYLGELTSEVLLVPLLSLSLYCLYTWDSKVQDNGASRGESQSRESNNEDAAIQEETSPARDSGASKRFGGGTNFLVGGGLFTGFAILTHPLALFFAVFEFAYYFTLLFSSKVGSPKQRSSTAAAPFIFALAAAIPILPVAYYNVAVLGADAPLQANGGFNFFLGNGPGADGTCRLRPGPEWDTAHAEAERDAKAAGTTKDGIFIKRTISHISSHPLEWASLLLRKSLYVWNWRELVAGADSWPLRYFTVFQARFKWAFGFCAVLALTGLFLNLRNPRYFHEYRHFLLLTAAFWFAQTILVTSGRYRIGMLPALLVLSSVGFVASLSKCASGGANALKCVLAVSAAAAIVILPKPPLNPERELAEARTIMGEALIRRGFFADAEKFLIASAKAVPNWSRNYNLLGLSLEKRRQYASADKAYRKAISVAPEDPTAYSNLATLYSERGHPEKAELYFKMAFSLGSPSAKLHYNYGLHCERTGRMADAVRQYDLCLKLDPAYKMALNNLGVIAFKRGKYIQAASLFSKALSFEPDNSRRMVNLAASLFLAGKKAEAKVWLRKALTLSPNSAGAIKLLREIREKEWKGI